MKKSMFLAMLAMVLLAGCSKESENIIDNGGNEGGDAPVLIQLGGTNSVTSNTTPSSRAALEVWNNTEVGVLGLAENATGKVWDITSYNTTCILNNVKGTITSGTDVQPIVIGTGHYYPLDNSINYTFYGYHPYSNSTTNTIVAETNENKVTVTYAGFDGTQDILWGKIKATTITGADDSKNYEGFNARYFRKMKTPTAPNIVFDHKLVRLKFNIKGGEGNITDLKVSSITLTKVPTSVSLVVADLPNTSEGSIQSGTKNGEYLLKKSDGAAADEINLHDGTNPIMSTTMGESIMVPVDAVDNGNYTAKIQLAYKDPNAATISPSEVLITPPATKTFEAGYAYNINIKINGLTEIEVTATLTPWEDGGSSDLEIN